MAGTGALSNPVFLAQVDAYVKTLRLSGDDEAAAFAVAVLAGRTNADKFEMVPDGRYWSASAHYRGHRVMAQRKTSAAQAADEVARQLLDHAQCLGCGKISFVADEKGYRLANKAAHERALAEGVCRWGRIEGGRNWVRECGEAAPADSTRERLAQALIELKVIPAGQIRAARIGRYDDFLSDQDIPQLTLIMELQQYGPVAQPLIRRVMDGEFESTPQESLEWAQTPDGRAALEEVFGPGGIPSNRREGVARASAQRRQRRTRRHK